MSDPPSTGGGVGTVSTVIPPMLRATDSATACAAAMLGSYCTIDASSPDCVELVASAITKPSAASSVVIRPAEPGTPLALATTTVAPSVTSGGSVVVVVVFSTTELSLVSTGPESTGVLPPSLVDPPSSVMLLRMRKPTMTATTASTMLIVEPIGDPPTPWRAERRSDFTGAFGSSLLMRALPLLPLPTNRRGVPCGPGGAAA